MHRRGLVALHLWLFLIIGIGGTTLSWAQSATTGALTGIITDATGAALPGVTVNLVNYGTSQTLATRTGAGGEYSFSLLPPGTYSVTFSLEGFKAAHMAEVLVSVSEAPTIVVILEPGDPGERVACQCTVSQAASSSTGTLVDSKTITSVPLTTRNSTQLMSMSSGSAADVNNAARLGSANTSVNVNGAAGGLYTVEGANSGGSGSIPNPDVVSEFKIQTSQYDAGYGAQVPSTNLITRPGTNEIHGTIWEFLRNDVFNANEYFQKATGQRKPNMKQNQYGGTVGGPIKKGKLFFFLSYQGTRQVNGLDPTSLSTLLLPPLTDDRSAAALASQFCSANHMLANGQADPRYLTFAGGKQLDCQNQNTANTASLHPVALAILQSRLPDGSYRIPTPQQILTSGPTAGLGFSSYSIPSTFWEEQMVWNTDYVISKKHTLATRVLAGGLPRQYRSFGSPLNNAGAPPFTPGSPEVFRPRNILSSVRVSSVLTDNVVNEARMAVTRSHLKARGPGIPAASSFGMQPANPFFPEVPEVTVLGPLGTFRFFGNAASGFSSETETYTWTDNVSWSRGKHTIRTGGFFSRQYNGRLDTAPSRGRMSFQTFSDFLLGLSAAENLSPGGRSNIQSVQASVGVGPNGEVSYKYRRYFGAAFLQDDFKVTSRFTLNLGLRWEYLGPSSDNAGTIGTASLALLQQMPVPPASGTLIGNTVAANYNPNLINPYTGQPFGPPPAGVVTRSTNSLYENDTPPYAFAPRLGFAWQPGDSQSRLSLRGGYGWFYQTPLFSGIVANTVLFTSPPFAQGFTNADSSNNLSNLQKPFPTPTLGYIPRTPTSQLSDRLAGPMYEISRIQQWNLNAQFRLSPSLTLDVGYVGSRGSDLLMISNRNQPLLASPANPVNCGLPNTAAGLGVSPATFATLGINSAGCVETNTALNARFRAPIVGETPNALAANEYIGESWYRSLQTTLRKQMSRGLSFQLAYTLSKTENNNINYNDQSDLSLDRALAPFNRTHRVIFNSLYQLPVLPVAGFNSSLFRNWSVSGIVIVQTGLPLTLTDPFAGGVYGRAGVSTVTLCSDASAANLTTSGTTQERLNGWIDTSAICPAATLGVGSNSTGYGSSRPSIVTGPGQFNVDLSLGKNMKVGGLREDAELIFRAEFYNAFNHAQFSNPGTTFGTANFGVITQTSVAPRLIQFGLKYLF